METNKCYDENLELSDSEDVFDFQVLKDIVEDNSDYDSDTSSSGSEIVLPKRRRMRIIESESEDSLEDVDKWRDVTEELVIPERIHFSVSPKVIGPQVPSNIVQPIQYFKLFFMDELVNEIIKETNNYAENVLNLKDISSNSIWQTWRDVEKDEFWALKVQRGTALYVLKGKKWVADVKQMIIVTLAQVHPECTWGIVSKNITPW